MVKLPAQSRPGNFRSRPYFTARVLLIAISATLGTHALFFIGPQVKSLDRSMSLWPQIASAAGVAYAYALVGFAAAKDIRWATVSAIVLTVIATPLFTLFWLMSGWSTTSADAAMPYLGYIAGNITLFVISVTVVAKLVNMGAWSNTR